MYLVSQLLPVVVLFSEPSLDHISERKIWNFFSSGIFISCLWGWNGPWDWRRMPENTNPHLRLKNLPAEQVLNVLSEYPITESQAQYSK